MKEIDSDGSVDIFMHRKILNLKDYFDENELETIEKLRCV